MFHARGPAAAKDRSPSDDIVRGTATELDVADLRPGLTVAAADGVISKMISASQPYSQASGKTETTDTSWSIT